MRSKLLTMIALALVTTFGSAIAYAGPATDAVKEKQTALFELIGKPQTDEVQAQIRAIFDAWLDYGYLAKASLGKHWDSLTDDQHKEFGGLLEQLVRKSYKKNLNKVLGYDINYDTESSADDDATVVKMRAKSRSDASEPIIEIDFSVKESNGRWLVLDIAPEGASLVKTYRSQFTKILQRDGYPALVAKMRTKIAQD
ncbi:MAG: ABC transporter substrate-binding protein [Myxococcales bacterium]|nr:ABC transporter substrate-binding protein [Myxococcales bacterium]